MTIRTVISSQFEPGTRREVISMPQGLTIYEMVSSAAKHLGEDAIKNQCRVTLISDECSVVIPYEAWKRVRPKPGTSVSIVVLADKFDLRTILTIIVAIAAIAAGQYWAGSILELQAGSWGYYAAATAMTIAITAIGQLLINAIAPPVGPEKQSAVRSLYSIQGLNNEVRQDGAVPVVLGTTRYSPPFAALTYTEIVGDEQYIRALFLVGEGRVSITDIRIGETPISNYDDIDFEVREGVEGDPPFYLMPDQRIDNLLGLELTRPLPRSSSGNVIEGGEAIETPVVRKTGLNASGACVIFAFPGGLFRYNDKGGRLSTTVRIRIERRFATDEEWQPVATLSISGKKTSGFYRSHEFSFPYRGAWEIRVTLLTPENTDSKIQRRVSWAVLQTIRPEYPINYPKPLSGFSLRMRATHQLSGQLDNVSALCSRICLDYDADASAWVTRATSNPASLYRYVLQSGHKPEPDSGLILSDFVEFHQFCKDRSLEYDKVLDDSSTVLRDIIEEVCAAGRATPRHNGVAWGVTIDGPKTVIEDHISPRNSWDFTWKRTYVQRPHAFRVKFYDKTNDYRLAERMIPWPGHTGAITLVEALNLPGITDPTMVWLAARRRQYEIELRPDVYTATQDGPARVAVRGSLVRLAHYVLNDRFIDARVLSVSDNFVIIDETISMESGIDYVIRFRVFDPAAVPEDVIGTSVQRLVSTIPGDHQSLLLVGSGQTPAPGTTLTFGEAAKESIEVVVIGVEATQDGNSILKMVDYAPEIDERLALDVVPEWSGRFGSEIERDSVTPAEPRFTSVASGVNGAGEVGKISYNIEAGAGSVPSTAFVIEHKLSSGSTWTSVEIPAADGGGIISGYETGDSVQLRAYAKSSAGASGPVSPTVEIEVGAGDADIPTQIPSDAVVVSPLLGGIDIAVSALSDPSTVQIQVYRSTSPTLDMESDAVGSPYGVEAGKAFRFALGDTTRATLLTNGAFESGSGWTLGAGWSIASGQASHAAGSAGAVSQAVSGIDGAKWYRYAYVVSGRSAGSITPELTGGYVRPGDIENGNGTVFGRIQAVTGNDTFQFSADADFNGSVDNAVLYLETSACLSQGKHYIWLEPLNDDNLPGPVSGPYEIDVF